MPVEYNAMVVLGNNTLVCESVLLTRKGMGGKSTKHYRDAGKGKLLPPTESLLFITCCFYNVGFLGVLYVLA
jgi:hypothetical protein